MKVLERIERFFGKKEETEEKICPICQCLEDEKEKRSEEDDTTLCSLCRQHHFSEPGSYEICPVCGWEDDRVQREDPDFAGGANTMSLNEAIKAYQEKEDA